MSQENVEIVQTLYDRLNDAYKTGHYLQPMEEICHPDVVLRTSGMFPESGDYRGHQGLREFTRNQADAFEQMWVRPAEFVDVGDRVVVPISFGGTARHTGIETTFAVVHVWTMRELKVSRLDMYRTLDGALEAVGLAE
jgi:ketosteroid isomerase-like protein